MGGVQGGWGGEYEHLGVWVVGMDLGEWRRISKAILSCGIEPGAST